MDAFQVDELKLYLGSSIQIAHGVALSQPTVGEIADYGEREYFHMAQMLCSTPSSMKVFLDDNHLDWMKISDFELFAMLCKMGAFPQSGTSLLLGDLDLSSLKLHEFGDGDVVLTNRDFVKDGEKPIVINDIIYTILTTYLRKMHGFKKQVDTAKNEITRRVLIDEDRKAANRDRDKPYKTFLLPMISALQGRQGYTREYIRNMGLYEFTNQFHRVQIIVQADAALNGMYSGFVDTKKMDKTVLDWTRDISEDSNKKNQTPLNEGAN